MFLEIILDALAEVCIYLIIGLVIGISSFFWIDHDDTNRIDEVFEIKKKHVYTDEECINSCFFFGKDGGYGGHVCLILADEDLEKTYREILREKGRQGLWEYGIEKGFFTNESDEYYGFFGKDPEHVTMKKP